ncbi:MAG: inositol monophosphatase [Deltaproteobacteria bacterium]|nr:inositol monophosphatase [Deltaproteobacteria bacterium]
MRQDELSEALVVARAIAEEAAALILGGFRSGTEVRKKGRIDLVTDYDLKSEALIRQRLGAAFPHHAIVGEEGEATGSGELVWFVDPLDGTTNFAHGHPFFCVSIGLCRGPQPLLGVVAAPAIGVTWSGAQGQGVLRNQEACHVSAQADLLDALAATGFGYDQATDDDNVRETRAALKRTHGIRRCGSAAMDLAMVADGTYDFYWEQRLNPWDLAAGACLVEAAGGRISGYEGQPADPRSGRLVASNGHLHDEVVALLAEARRDLTP